MKTKKLTTSQVKKKVMKGLKKGLNKLIKSKEWQDGVEAFAQYENRLTQKFAK